MKTLFAVTRSHGPAWDKSKPMESQDLWSEHAAFMNDLAAKGFVVLGGPIGDGRQALLIIDAPDEATIHDTLALDPWTPSRHLVTRDIKGWTIRLDAGEYR